MRISLRGCAALAVGFFATAGAAWGVTYTSTFADETGTGSLGTGTAIVTFDPVAHTLRVQADFSGLTGTTTNAHIHAPTALPLQGNAGVATQLPTFSGFPAGVTLGTYDMTFDLTQAASWNPAFVTANGGTPASAEAAFASFLAEGRAYFNIHSSFAGGGEIRAWLPEPATGLALLIGAGVIAMRPRRKRA